MGFFDSFTGAAQRKDLKRGYAESSAMVNSGYDAAGKALGEGFTGANALYDAARGDVTGGYNTATDTLTGYTDKAAGYLEPYLQSGQGANALYSNALGVNGVGAQTDFWNNYQNYDPFRAQNADMATKALMQAYNARGLSGSGVAAQAVARENLARGSTDANAYLDRLNGLGQAGQSAAGGLSSLYANAGQTQAGMDYGYGSDLANITGQKANLGYNYGTAQAGLATDRANTLAGNRINFANAMSDSRSTGINNLLQVAGLGLKATGWGGFGNGK